MCIYRIGILQILFPQQKLKLKKKKNIFKMNFFQLQFPLLRGRQPDRRVRASAAAPAAFRSNGLQAGVLPVERDRVQAEGVDRHLLRDHPRAHQLDGRRGVVRQLESSLERRFSDPFRKRGGGVSKFCSVSKVLL